MQVWSQDKGVASLGLFQVLTWKNISENGFVTEDLLQMAESRREQGEETENIKLLKPKKTRNKSDLP